MARPYFTGDYGSPLMSNQAAAMLVADQGAKTGQMYAQAGKDIGGVIKEYGLNKQKRAELTNKIESTIKLNPDYMTRMTSTGIEADDKKAQTLQDKLTSGNANMTELKGLAGELAMMEAQDLKEAAASRQALTDALKVSQLRSEEQTRTLKDENRELTRIAKIREEQFYGKNEKRLNDLTVAVGSGQKSFSELSHQEKFILGNADGIRSRNIPPEKLHYDPDAEFDHEKAKVEYNKLKKEVKLTDQAIAKGEREEAAAKAEPTFASMDAITTWEATLPAGVEAVMEKHKDGWNVNSLKVTSKDRVKDIPSVPGYPNYKIVGGYVYEGDPDKKTLTKLGAEQPGRETELLIKVIGAMSTPDVEQYRKAKLRGTPSDDGKFFVFEDPVSGVEYEIPFNQALEDKIAEIKRFEDQMKSSMPNNTVDLRTR